MLHSCLCLPAQADKWKFTRNWYACTTSLSLLYFILAWGAPSLLFVQLMCSSFCFIYVCLVSVCISFTIEPRANNKQRKNWMAFCKISQNKQLPYAWQNSQITDTSITQNYISETYIYECIGYILVCFVGARVESECWCFRCYETRFEPNGSNSSPHCENALKINCLDQHRHSGTSEQVPLSSRGGGEPDLPVLPWWLVQPLFCNVGSSENDYALNF